MISNFLDLREAFFNQPKLLTPLRKSSKGPVVPDFSCAGETDQAEQSLAPWALAFSFDAPKFMELERVFIKSKH